MDLVLRGAGGMIFGAMSYCKALDIPLVESYHTHIPRLFRDTWADSQAHVGFDLILERLRRDDSGDVEHLGE